jgi:hypothetical protein
LDIFFELCGRGKLVDYCFCGRGHGVCVWWGGASEWLACLRRMRLL